MEMSRAVASREALANGTLQLPPAALVELRKRKAADAAEARAERAAAAAAAGDASDRSSDDAAAAADPVMALTAPMGAAESARLHQFALERIVAGADRLLLSALRLEHTVLLLRDLHYNDVPRLTGMDVLDVEAAIGVKR